VELEALLWLALCCASVAFACAALSASAACFFASSAAFLMPGRQLSVLQARLPPPHLSAV